MNPLIATLIIIAIAVVGATILVYSGIFITDNDIDLSDYSCKTLMQVHERSHYSFYYTNDEDLENASPKTVLDEIEKKNCFDISIKSENHFPTNMTDYPLEIVKGIAIKTDGNIVTLADNSKYKLESFTDNIVGKIITLEGWRSEYADCNISYLSLYNGTVLFNEQDTSSYSRSHFDSSKIVNMTLSELETFDENSAFRKWYNDDRCRTDPTFTYKVIETETASIILEGMN